MLWAYMCRKFPHLVSAFVKNARILLVADQMVGVLGSPREALELLPKHVWHLGKYKESTRGRKEGKVFLRISPIKDKDYFQVHMVALEPPNAPPDAPRIAWAKSGFYLNYGGTQYSMMLLRDEQYGDVALNLVEPHRNPMAPDRVALVLYAIDKLAAERHGDVRMQWLRFAPTDEQDADPIFDKIEW